MNCENFLLFTKTFEAYIHAKHNDPERIKDTGRCGDQWLPHIVKSISESKIFEVDEDVKKLLCLTKTPLNNDDINLPFPYNFIDVKFTKEELAKLGIEIKARQIIGIMFSKGELTHQDTKEYIGKNLRITILTDMNKNGKDIVWFDTFNECNNITNEKYKHHGIKITKVKSDNKSKKFAHRFILNFLNFINDPNIKVIERTRSQKNIERRKKQGKKVLPISYSIRLQGELKRYIDTIKSGNMFHYNHSFWVRGHFRTLRSDRYKEKKRLWIPPFIKGNPALPLVDKKYILKK